MKLLFSQQAIDRLSGLDRSLSLGLIYHLNHLASQIGKDGPFGPADKHIGLVQAGGIVVYRIGATYVWLELTRQTMAVLDVLNTRETPES